MKMGIRNGLLDFGAVLAGQFTSADLSIFHEFEPPPTGGGQQFLRAFRMQAEMHGLRVENNIISRTTRACLFNSFNFNEKRLQRTRRSSVLYVHRVDGPIGVYRGWDDGVDGSTHAGNQKYAEKTIFQSRYSLEKHLELGMQFRKPVIIMNAADPHIFHARGRAGFSSDRKTRLIASSWSDNPNKGALVYQWLDENLDWTRFEMTFVGRSPVVFKNIYMMPAVDSFRMADLFRGHDVYLTASRNDPCSNSLIEALTCGLPAIYFQSGGHPEIVGQGGAGFEMAEQIPGLLEQIVKNYRAVQSIISVPSMEQVSELYLQILGLMDGQSIDPNRRINE
ncbi:MAG: glycosyltransferase family 4 protein [Anaerolineales bacterium]|nr:glycosyltransferase family 4 protein [Anaerolineales bacterium]